MQQPTRLISTPFAQEGEKTEIQNVTGEFDNSATYRLGFPPLTMQSIRLGGKPPKGTDFNGVLFDITENISFLCKGGRYQYNAGLSTLIGGYPEGSNLLLDDNVTEVVSTVAGNQNNPNTDMTGWTFKPNRTTAVNVADASGETQQQVNYNGGSKWHSRVGGYQENERVVLANGDIVKSTVDGNTNDPNVDMTGWEKPTISDELVIVKRNYAGAVARTQEGKNSERVSVKDFGAKGDGVTDDSTAIINGINYAQANNIELYFPSGVYAIKSWTSITLSGSLKMSGDGFNNSIIRGLNSDSFTLFRKIKSLVIQHMCFEDLTTVFDYNVGQFETWIIDNLVITDCLFKGLGYCGRLSTYSGSADLYTARNLKVTSNRVEDCGGGFYLNINSFESAINDNVFLRIGAQNRKLITVAGISVGADNLLDEANTRLQGRTIINGNIFKDFLNTEPEGQKGACNFIQMFSNEAIISNNIGVNLKNTNPLLSDQEALYWKGKKVQVLNNTFIDAGGYEAVIRCKGIAALIPDIVVIKNNLIIFNETSLNQRIGINVTEGNCFIANNVLVGCGAQGIVVGNEYEVANSVDIINNQILGLNTSSRYCRGISLLNNGDIRVKNNVIKYSQITATAAYAINIEVLIYPLNGINIEIEGNSISYLNGVGGESGSCRGIFINYDSATVINSLSIIGNKTYVPTSDREVYGYRGTGTINSMYFMNNILNVGAVSALYDYVHTGTVTNRFVTGNTGYPTLDTIKKGVTANRPVSPSLGDRYYDTTLLASGKPITWNGTTWVDAAGTPV